jgi:hypothetical protein
MSRADRGRRSASACATVDFPAAWIPVITTTAGAVHGPASSPTILVS